MKTGLPEISRISPFEGNDVIQIFAENADSNTELYVWYNSGEAIKYQQNQEIYAGKRDKSNEYKRSLAKNLPISCENVDNILNELPDTPPADAIILKPDEVEGRVLYFGEQTGPDYTDGRYRKRAADGTSVMWLKNEAGFSRPCIANRPQIWNQSLRVAYPGSRISFYGVNFGKPIQFSDGTHFAKIGAAKNLKTGEYFRLEGLEEPSYPSDVQQHIAEFRIPKSAPEGEYEIYMHSGKCGRFGWSEPAKIQVKSDYTVNEYFLNKWSRQAGDILSLPKCEVISVIADDVTPFADYAHRIQSAIDEIYSKGGGIVMLSAGTFPISKTVVVKSGVVLLGSGVATVLKASEEKGLKQNWDNVIFTKKKCGAMGWANDWLELLKEHNEGAAVRLLDHSGVESLKIELGNGANIGVFVADDKDEYANNVFVNHVTVDSTGLSELEMDGYYAVHCAGLLSGSRTENLTVFNCTFSATMPITVLPARHLYPKFINNNFFHRPRQIHEAELFGIRNGIISNNHFDGGRRSLVSMEGFSNNWVYQNRSTDVNRAFCALEAYMSEYGRGSWYGKGAECSADYIDVKESYEKVMVYRTDVPFEIARDEFRYFLFVLNGRGFGQYREVVDIKEIDGGCRLYLDRPFDVIPDESTAFTLTTGTHNNLWIHNNNTLSNGHSQFIWGSGFDNVVSGHAMDLAAGLRFYAYHGNCHEGRPGVCTSVCAFNIIAHCQTRSSGTGITFDSERNVDHTNPVWEDFLPTRGIFGNSVKENAFDGASGHIYVKNLISWSGEKYNAGMEIAGGFNRIVANRIMGYENAVVLINDCKGNCFAKNIITGEKQRFIGEGTPCGTDSNCNDD